jgi:DNA-binding transcriptional regulator YhcF (GntR family)
MSFSADDLFDFDVDDPRTPSQQIADALRAAILIGRLASGDRLPSQLALAQRYQVARETVRSALRILDRDQLIVSRQGSGAFVRSRPSQYLDLRAILRGAFDRQHVSIDYAGFRGETLSNVLPDALDVVREGRVAVSSLQIRMLLVDPTTQSGMPRLLGRDPAEVDLRPALSALTRTAVTKVKTCIDELLAARLITRGSVHVRVHGLGPVFKAYMLNDQQVLFGFYPVSTHALRTAQGDVDLYHPSGWEATLFDANDGSALNLAHRADGPEFTGQAREWFESVWDTISYDFPAG